MRLDGTVRRIAAVVAACAALAAGGAAMAASGGGTASTVDGAAVAQAAAQRVTTTPAPTTTLAIAPGAAPVGETRGPGTLLFPMNPEPNCLLLDNWGEVRPGGVHQGTDIMSSLGQGVYAVRDGVLVDQVIDGEPGSSKSGNTWVLRASHDETPGGIVPAETSTVAPTTVGTSPTTGPTSTVIAAVGPDTVFPPGVGAVGDEYKYMHLSGFAEHLSVGSTVVKGQLIGFVGDTGNPGPGNYHLHFEVHPLGSTSTVDPYPLFDIPVACQG